LVIRAKRLRAIHSQSHPRRELKGGFEPRGRLPY
jgi:hypothetical protein